MSKQTIQLGTPPSGVGGDTPRSAFAKVNDNFTELYQFDTANYKKTNIVGPVSQTGGVPSGAIIETGSNANGTWTKYADGTMICRQTVDCGPVVINNPAGSLFASAYQAGKGFAATFSAFPTCHINLISSNATAYAGTVALPSVSASQAFYVIAPQAATQSITAVITAIGRWF